MALGGPPGLEVDASEGQCHYPCYHRLVSCLLVGHPSRGVVHGTCSSILVVGEDRSGQIPKIALPIISATAWSIQHQTLPARHMRSSFYVP
ncbi:hypothetical protein RSAG8_09210, partial [Rhizoctonia solani AG-8 WAC10335]